MDYVIFDLEWNQCPYGKGKENPKLPFEIIEIGAVKMDGERNVEIVLTVLEENGIHAKHVKDGALCLKAVQNAPEDYYDVILMDIQMPNMNGYQAAEAIRALPGKRGEIPIVAMTANAFEEDRRKALESGMNAHIAKPVDVSVLLETLSRFS